MGCIEKRPPRARLAGSAGKEIAPAAPAPSVSPVLDDGDLASPARESPEGGQNLRVRAPAWRAGKPPEDLQHGLFTSLTLYSLSDHILALRIMLFVSVSCYNFAING